MFEKIKIASDYARSAFLKCRGAKLSSKVRVSENCRFTLPSQVSLGHRVVLEPNSTFKLVSDKARIDIEDYAFVGRGCLFDISGELSIGKGTLLAPDCFVVDHNHGVAAGEMIWTQPCVYKPVTIGSDVWLGARSVILPGVHIGDGAVVAAGAVVTKSVEPMTIVAGVPAKFVRDRI